MYWSAAEVALVPPAVVTRISTVPVPAGAVAVIEVALFTVKLLAAVAPKVTAVVPNKPVPVMFTVVPPEVRPAVGERAVTVGSGAVRQLADALTTVPDPATLQAYRMKSCSPATTTC